MSQEMAVREASSSVSQIELVRDPFVSRSCLEGMAPFPWLPFNTNVLGTHLSRTYFFGRSLQMRLGLNFCSSLVRCKISIYVLISQQTPLMKDISLFSQSPEIQGGLSGS